MKKKIHVLITWALAMILGISAYGTPVTVYENDFENPPYAEWSFNSTPETHWEFLNGTLRLKTGAITVGLVDQVISGDFKMSMDVLWEGDNTAGIVFHAQDFTNHFFVDLRPGGSTNLRIRRATGDLTSFTNLVVVPHTFAVGTHRVDIEYNDTDKTLSVSLAGQLLLDKFVIVDGFSSGKIGVYGNWSNLGFDNMVITQTPDDDVVTYSLTVNNGTGDGNYEEDEVVSITADAPPAGQRFAQWTGDVANIANVKASATTITMPAEDVVLTAEYEVIPVEYAAMYENDFENPPYLEWEFSADNWLWNTSSTNVKTLRLIDGGVIAGYVDRMVIGDFTLSIDIMCEWQNHQGIIFGQDFDNFYFVEIRPTTRPIRIRQATGDASNIGSLPILAEGPFAFAEWETYRINIVVKDKKLSVSVGDQLVIDQFHVEDWDSGKVGVFANNSRVRYDNMVLNYTGEGYTLDVTNGSGSGTYLKGSEVEIEADAGQQFVKWTGDIAHVADVNASTTSVTIPADHITLTAEYEDSTPDYVVIYENDFENPPYPEWIFNTVKGDNWDFVDGNIQLMPNEITVGLIDQVISGDFTVSMDILWESDNTAGIVFHAQDFVNHIFVDLKPTGNGLRLRKATGALSGFTLLTQVATTFELNEFHRVDVTYNDSDKSLTVTMNNQLLLDKYVIAGGFDSGKIGIYGNWSPLRFDNILITKPIEEDEYANQIVNAGFEEDNLPWHLSWNTVGVIISRDTNSELNGIGSLKVEVPTVATNSWEAGVRYNNPVHVEEGESYIFSFRAKADERRTFHFDVKTKNELKFLDEKFDIRVDARNFAFGFTATESAELDITLLPTAHGATMYFDDFSFIKVAEEQVPNGDFEEDYFPWEYAWGADNATFSHDKTSAMDGEGSLKIEVTTVGAAWDAGIRNSFHMYVEKDKVYEFTFDAKADAARDLYFDIVDIWRGGNKLLDRTVALTTDKQTFSFKFVAGVSDVARIQWMPNAAAATVYIDNISLKEAELVMVNSIVVTGADNATEISVVGGTLQMSAEVLPADANNKEVVWSVVNGTGEATISATGLLTAVKNGDVVVKATSADGSGIVGEKTITITGQDTSVSEIAAQFKFYPNPAVDQLTIISNSIMKQIDIISIDGRTVQSAKVNSAQADLSVGALKSGIYLIRITDENTKIAVHRFIKE